MEHFPHKDAVVAEVREVVGQRRVIVGAVAEARQVVRLLRVIVGSLT